MNTEARPGMPDSGLDDARLERLLREYAVLEDKHVSPERKSFIDRLKTYFED